MLTELQSDQDLHSLQFSQFLFNVECYGEDDLF